MDIIRVHTVPEGSAPARLGDYAIGLFPELPSRNAAKKAIKRGELLVDGAPAGTGRWVGPGARVELLEGQGKAPVPYRLALGVHYEDGHLAVVEQPPGLVVMGNRFKTAENALAGNLAPSPREDALASPRPVHRLDARTGGLLLIAKTRSALIELGRAMENREVEKRYRAVLAGRLEGAGSVTAPVGGREAESGYRALRHVRSLKNGWLTLAGLCPRTGGTHQRRVHMAGLGHPVMGDGLYGEKGRVRRGKGLFLHAVGLSFTHPATGERLNIETGDPDKFAALLEREERRWRKYHCEE